GVHAAPVRAAVALARRQRQRERSQGSQVGAGPQVECTEDRTHEELLVPTTAGGGSALHGNEKPAPGAGFGLSAGSVSLLACLVSRPRIARTIIRTAIVAVGGVAGDGLEAGHGWQ